MKELEWCSLFLSNRSAETQPPQIRQLVRYASHYRAKLMPMSYYVDDADLLKLVSAAVERWLLDVTEALSLSEPMHPAVPGILCQLWRGTYSYIPVSGMALFMLRLSSGEWEFYRKLGSNDLCGAFRKYAAEYTNAMVVFKQESDGWPEYPRELLPEYVNPRRVPASPMLSATIPELE